MITTSSIVMAEQVTQTQPVEAVNNFQVESYLGTWYEKLHAFQCILNGIV